MTVTRGMDTDEARRAAGAFDDGARELEALAGRIDAMLHGFEWFGPDADRTRDDWGSTQRPRLALAGQHLSQLATRLQSEADQQDGASGESTGGGASGSWAPSDAQLAQAGGALGWMGRRLEAIGAGLRRQVDAAADLGGKVLDVLTGREEWSTAEIAASAINVVGTGVGTAVNAVTGEDQNWFGETAGVAGEPRAVPLAGNVEGRPPLTAPTDAATLMQGVEDAYAAGEGNSGTVRITTVTNADGTTGYVVAIAGTENWMPGAGPFVRDLTANTHLMAGRPTAAVEAVEQAMVAAGIPPGADVMLVGHSQGGMIAGELAAKPSFLSTYQVSQVMTFGAPVDHLAMDPSVRVLQVQHGNDWVPRLDLGGIGPTTGGFPGSEQVVTLPSPGGILAPVENHNYSRYVESVRNATEGTSAEGQVLRSWQNDPSLARFLVGDGDSASAVDVPIMRGERR